ncbi:MAG: hypothetical protein NUV74_05270 [Candidatus Brocadiaceae bacterium]|nr:hypothetical protein [Candidatus Brocadiaceae bacterium]
MSTDNAKPKADGAESVSTAGLGVCVLVRGAVVAWFADFDEAARGWCTENHFGEWLTWRAKPPEIVPLTPEEVVKVEQDAAELYAKLTIL